jgi:class 3 adenylate cyclase/ABC-type nitrate/sulfonate/bicarbonate transport system substrate-binding protein
MQLSRCTTWGVILTTCITLVAAAPAFALDKVSLQLKWKHQFQFAGYYAALEKGFYRDAGFETEIREGGPHVNSAKVTAAGEADFGVCTASVLLDRALGLNLVVLGVIFQHSAATLLVPRRAGVGAVSDLKGRRLMDTPGSDEIAAMLKREGVDYASLSRVDHTGDPRDLAGGKADAMVAYSTNEPFVLNQLGVPYQTFSPRSYGIDFYGDSLCTSAQQALRNSKRIRAFTAASLKGWEYALSHKEEIVDLILRSYSREKSRDALVFEAIRTEALIRPNLIQLGHQNAQRWKNIADAYRDLGMLTMASEPEAGVFLAESSIPVWLKYVLLGLGLLAVAAASTWLWIAYLGRRLKTTLGTPKLSAVISFLFICLTIPALIFILLYNHHTNSASITATLRDSVDRTNRASIENIENFIQPIAGALRILAAAAAVDPSVFRTEPSREFLYGALTAAPQIDAVYVSFDDGYHRVVTRIDDDRRRSDPLIPPSANWHSSYVDDFSAGTKRGRHRTFFDTWPRAVGQYSTPSTLDVRTLAGYAEARESGSLVITEATINPDTGSPIISLRYPIERNGKFIGCASANVTMDILSRFLSRHRTSANSVTIIADPSDGKIITLSDMRKGIRTEDGQLQLARLDTIADDNVREAYRHRVETNEDNFAFHSPVTGAKWSASFTRFPNSFGQPWEAINLTPINDFVGALETANRQMVGIIIVLTIIELLLIYFASARLARPIETVSRELKSVESMAFDAPRIKKSNIQEIAGLQSAATLLRTSLQSFSSFVPLDIVRELIRSGTPLSLGVESRFLTVFFSDLENFSTKAEQMAPGELLDQMSTYFEQVSKAISDEHGTVDKFIGDGIMAFWGAPAPRPDHVLRACSGALRAARRMEKVNRTWSAEGRPGFRMRIGLNCANMLVGNVGSSERLSYTVMGDGVNVAARLEDMNKRFGTTICISDSVFEAVEADIVARPLQKVRVKGRDHEFMVYELLGIRCSEDPELEARGDELKSEEST